MIHLPKVRLHPQLNVWLRHVEFFRKQHTHEWQPTHACIASSGSRSIIKRCGELHDRARLRMLGVMEQQRQFDHACAAAVTAKKALFVAKQISGRKGDATYASQSLSAGKARLLKHACIRYLDILGNKIGMSRRHLFVCSAWYQRSQSMHCT